MSSETGTRARIQEVAIDLFTEQGYEATSLREIAERLGVTKAALYYHFKSKEEIVESLMQDQAARLDALIDWAHGQPSTAETRREFIRRYAAMLFEGGSYNRFMRFVERNQSSAQKLHAGASMRDRMTKLLEVLTVPEEPLTMRLRRALAIIALNSSYFVLRDVADDVRRETATEVALALVE